MCTAFRGFGVLAAAVGIFRPEPEVVTFDSAPLPVGDDVPVAVPRCANEPVAIVAAINAAAK